MISAVYPLIKSTLISGLISLIFSYASLPVLMRHDNIEQQQLDFVLIQRKTLYCILSVHCLNHLISVVLKQLLY